MNQPEQPIETVRHGIAAAFYSSDGEKYLPCLECICGESYREFNWEETGAEFDSHLKESVTP